MTQDQPAADIPVDALREKYRIEREKRLRTDGLDQYKELKGELEEFDRDPYAEPLEREPIVEETEAVVVGGGFGGMLAAINLRKEGVRDFRIVEKAGDFGGTWYWNRYPGCMCDVESYVYMPLLEDTGYMPTMRYAPAAEIFAYCQMLGRHFDLYDNALFQTEITDAVWDDDTHRWQITTSRGDRLSARFLVIAGGVLHKAKLPGIPGIEDFQGKAFHTSRWDYSYTGGSPTEPMTNLADKRVGIIGTGATAVQVVPQLARDAEELYVFQRTPASVGWRGQGPTDPEWFQEISSEPGWQTRRIQNFTQAVCGEQPSPLLVKDGWIEHLWVDTMKTPESDEEAQALELEDFETMERIRQRVAEIVEDPETAAKLMPWYGKNCKRPCFHDDYLPAFNQPNVHLVDTDGQGVERITATGVVVDGVEYPVDVLVFASGFEVTTDYHRRLGFDPKGRDGEPLSDGWGNGAHTLHGVFTNGFPNLLMISTIQGGYGANFVHYLTETSRHVAHVIAACEREGILEVESDRQAEEDWLMMLWGRAMGVGLYNASCTPGYLNSEQQAADEKAARSLPWMGNVMGYADQLEAWRSEGTFPGTRVVRQDQPA